MKLHKRLGARPRCIRCRMRTDLCLCAEIVPLMAKTRLVVVMHAKEANKPTNTAHLVKAMLPATEIRIRGRRDREAVDLGDLAGAAVLFPLEDAEDLTPAEAPETLIVPDGSWSQARALVRRELMGYRHVRLPPGPPAELRLRAHRDPGSLSTLEAVARALAVLGERETSEEMMRVFRIMVERVLASRGGR